MEAINPLLPEGDICCSFGSPSPTSCELSRDAPLPSLKKQNAPKAVVAHAAAIAKNEENGAGPVDTRYESPLNDMSLKLLGLLLKMMFGLVELLSVYAKYPTKEHAKTESPRLIEKQPFLLFCKATEPPIAITQKRLS